MPETPEVREVREVRYFVLTDGATPYLLARVRWPDIAQAVTAGCPDWRSDPGLFDLPTDPVGVRVSADEAAAIAAAWGVHLSSGTSIQSSGLSMIRRMPANWSNLAPAEIRAWALEDVDTNRRVEAGGEARRAHARHAAAEVRLGRWWSWRLARRAKATHAGPDEPARPDAVDEAAVAPPASAPDWDLVMESIASMAGPVPVGDVVGTNGHVPVSSHRAPTVGTTLEWDAGTATVGRATVSATLDGTDDVVALGPALETRSLVELDPGLDPGLDPDGGTGNDRDRGVASATVNGGHPSEVISS